MFVFIYNEHHHYNYSLAIHQFFNFWVKGRFHNMARRRKSSVPYSIWLRYLKKKFWHFLDNFSDLSYQNVSLAKLRWLMVLKHFMLETKCWYLKVAESVQVIINASFFRTTPRDIFNQVSSVKFFVIWVKTHIA